jgi:hypothetical protein
MRSAPVLTLGVSLTLAAFASAADFPIAGTKLVIRDRGTSRKVVFVSRDAAAPFPAPGSADDPTGVGVMIDVVTPDAVASLAVPAGFGWTAGTGTYRYSNRLAPDGPSPVRTMTLRQGRVLKVSAKALPLSLAASLGSAGIRITTGATRTCAFFGGSSIVSDEPGAFVGRSAAGSLTDCSDYSLGLAPVCGNGLLEPGEACDGGAVGACPSGCDPDCTCAAYCGDGALDAGEQCDGTEFGPSVGPGSDPSCTFIEGLASAECRADCTCCAKGVCSAFGFDATCCPGFACPPRIGPNSMSFCQPTCTTDADCAPGDICFFDNFCHTPHCSSNEECGSALGSGICILGICCVDFGGQLICG